MHRRGRACFGGERILERLHPARPACHEQGIGTQGNVEGIIAKEAAGIGVEPFVNIQTVDGDIAGFALHLDRLPGILGEALEQIAYRVVDVPAFL